MNLNELPKIKGNRTKSKRLGRGIGSGKGGHTVGFGTKGQKSRTGNSIPFGFEGGQVPLYKRMPQIGGFNNPTKKAIVAVPLSTLNKFKEGSTVTPDSLKEAGLLRKIPRHGVKILSTGEIEKKLNLEGFLMSESAKAKLEKAGCTIK